MKRFIKNNAFLIFMLLGIIAGCVVGLVSPEFAGKLEPLGTIFTNLMFCVVVPMVFCSISSAIANMQSMKRAGKIMGVTVLTFCITAGIAALIMYIIARVFPIVGGAYEIVEGDQVDITVAPKGFGSENMSRVFMLKPADGIEGVKNAILTAVKDAGPNACPPMVVGVGIGGTFEKCALMAKKALTRPVNERSDIPYVKDMEIELLEKINQTGIGPGGLGGVTTALAVNINTYPTHIAGLPVAVNICCHVNRHAVREL